MPVEFKEIENAFGYVNSGPMYEHQAFLNKETGDTYIHSDSGDNFEELPDNIDDEKYIEIPHKHELNLGQKLVFDFINEYIPEEEEQFGRIFRRRGAYTKFKNFLDRNNLLEKWYAFESEAEERALRAWCERNEIDI